MESEKKRRKMVQSEGRVMIAKVYHFLKDEYTFSELYKEPHCDLSHLRNITKRTAEATGVSVRTVQKILKEERELPTGFEFPPPLKNRKKRACKVDINERVAYTIRSSIRECYFVEKQIPTLQKLKKALIEKIGFTCCVGTLRKLLLKLGYTWTNTDTGRKALIERHDIQMCKLQYLKKITEYRSQGRPIVYTDESYVMTNNVTASGRTSKVDRYILAHAGTDAGFINDACLVYQTNFLSGDDCAKMDFQYYQKWLDEKLLPNLPNRSVIVLDSTSFNDIFVETMPTMHSDKHQMEAWLTSKGITFDKKMRQIELYDLIKQHKSAFTTYKIDNYIKSKGFEVLRLPPNHPELNAILNVWETVKQSIVTFEHDITHTEENIHECVSKITSETWHSICNKVIEKEIEYLEYLDAGFVFLANLEDERVQDATDSEVESSDEVITSEESS